MAYKIYKITDCITVDYAAEELKKYLRMMMPECGDIDIKRAFGGVPEDGFVLGLMSDFGISTEEADDLVLDDILHIDTTDNAGIIAGSNARSVLMAAYRFLYENGCRWLYPGVDGEIIPMQDVHGVKYHKLADMRFRGWCNEGAESQQCMMETIEFAPKIGLNTYMIEFFNPFSYYDGYYSHVNNTANRLPEPVSKDTVLQWKRMCECEIQKRGLQFHDIGHGWTAESFGLSTVIAWSDLTDFSVPKEIEPYIAMMDGKRQLYCKGAMNTNFCMSNAKARELFVKKVADYAEAHKNITYLHVWLADFFNNHCECDECRKMIVSDWYVMLLNELDAELTKRELDTRIVYIIYYETVWAPEQIQLKVSNRFSAMLAPLGRRYTKSFEGFVDDSELEPFVLNKIEIPKTLDKCFTRLKTWQEMWKGPCLCYEYHFYTSPYYDVGSLYFPRRIYEDIQSLPKVNIRGYIEDGSQRCFFPNGLNMSVYASTLFDINADYDEIVSDYLEHAYGKHTPTVKKYFEELTEIFDFVYMQGKATVDKAKGNHYDPSRLASFEKVAAICDEMEEYVKANYVSDVRAQTVSMRLLMLHVEYARGIAEIMKKLCVADTDGLDEMAEDFYESLGKKEAELERYYDQYLCVYSLRHRLAKGQKRNVGGLG